MRCLYMMYDVFRAKGEGDEGEDEEQDVFGIWIKGMYVWMDGCICRSCV